MFFLFFEPKIDQLPRVRLSQKFFAIPRDEVSRPSAIPELELRERGNEELKLFFGKLGRRLPIRLVAVPLIVVKVGQPAIEIHRLHRGEDERQM